MNGNNDAIYKLRLKYFVERLLGTRRILVAFDGTTIYIPGAYPIK